jgi:hypothetical protein
MHEFVVPKSIPNTFAIVAPQPLLSSANKIRLFYSNEHANED